MDSLLKKEGEEYQECDENHKSEEEEGLTEEEREDLETLHQEEMSPTLEEEDWMLLIVIKEQRNVFAKKYFPVLSNYEVGDICHICERDF